MRLATLASLALVLAIALAGCATETDTQPTPATASATPGASTPTSSASATPAATPVPTATTPAPADDGHVRAEIVVENFRFTPATLTIEPGEFVMWVNLDAASHTATAENREFDIALDGGATEGFGSLVNGTIPYFCKLHPSMRGTLIIGDGQREPVPVVSAPAPTPATTPAPAPTPTPAPATPTPSPTAAPAERTVDIHNFNFLPATISIPVGTTVRWANADGASHSATADDSTFDTGVLASGASGTATFPAAGSFGYFCKVHPSMRGTVTVTA